ncbi:MAG: FliH/SctL family protein [Acidobacteriaceae bacterium]
MLEPIRAGIAAVTIHPMEYRAMLEAGLAPAGLEAGASPSAQERELLARVAELEREIEQRSQNFDAGLRSAHEQAREEGRAMASGEYAARNQAAAQALTEALTEFAAARDRYLAQVEREVVRLALAIAARVLHREALMDPLLLAGAVRVALGQLAENTEVRLKVPSTEQAMWEEMLRLMPNLPLRPELVADPRLKTGECLLETQLGSVDLGVKSQLAEIERGFFDLLDQREQGSGLRAQGSEVQRSAISDQRSERQGSGLRAEGSEEQLSAFSGQRSDRRGESGTEADHSSDGAEA